MRILWIGLPFALSAIGSTQTAPTVDTKASWYELGGQVTILPQTLLPFHDPYDGPRSLVSYFGTRTTESMTAYLGARVTPGLELYFDPECLMGAGLGNTTGVSGFPNVEIVRIGVEPIPYIARAFARATISTGHGTIELPAGENQIAEKAPAHRLVLTVGKMAATDIFDTNAYSNSGRTQFMNWALVNNPAYDYDADVRGYTVGAALAWEHPNWALRLGSFEMPTIANGPTLASYNGNNQGDQAEVEWKPKDGTAFRLMAYENHAHMGNYSEALAAQGGGPPNIVAVEKTGATKTGFELNGEHALGDGGDTGLFARVGFNDGRTETYAYTEADQALAIGMQVSGNRWRSPKDRIGIALVDEGLSAPHREYLAAGGEGFMLGDGRLNYGQERILEVYYARQLNKLFQASADFQLIQNPGYNQDRGPVPVVSFRLHLEF